MRSFFNTSRIGGDEEGEPAWKKPAPPISRREAAWRWIFFIPCAAAAYFTASYLLLFMGEGAWIGLLKVGARTAPYPPYLYTLFFSVFAAGIAALIGISLGAIVAPAHRGIAGAVLLLGLLIFDIASFWYYQRHTHFKAMATILLESAANLGMGYTTLRGVVRVFGWFGRNQASASAYWNEKLAAGEKRER